MDASLRIHTIQPEWPVAPKEKKVKFAKALQFIQSSLKMVGQFFATSDLPTEIQNVAGKVKDFAAQFFQQILKQVKIPISAPPPANVAYAANGMIGLGNIVGGVASIYCLVKAGQMIRRAVRLVAKGEALAYAKSLFRKGVREVATQAANIAVSVLGIVQTAVKIASLAQVTLTSLALTLAQVATLIAAPISLCLSAYGAKVNVERIGTCSIQLRALREELERIQGRKEHAEREEILRFAIRKLSDKRMDNIASLISNGLFMAASVLSLGSLAAGPGAAVMGTIALVCVAVGGLGHLATRGILAVVRRQRKSRQIEAMKQGGPRYISTEEMRAKAKEIMAREPSRPYWERTSMAKMSNGEILAYLMQEPGERIAPQDMREGFIAGEKHFWSLAF